MKAVIDNALPPEMFAALAATKASAEGLDQCVGNQSVHHTKEFQQAEFPPILLEHVKKVCGNVEWTGAYYVLTSVGHYGSSPHYDEGPSAILHLATEWSPEYGGELLFLESDEETVVETVEYRPNRLVVFSGEHCHMHKPPVLDKNRITLVSRFIERPNHG